MNAVEKFVQTARNAGSPKDQVKNFLVSGYVPLPWQWKFHAVARTADKTDGPVDIGVGGSRGPGKSHGVFAQVTLDDCVRIPHLKGLFLRQTGKSAKESFEDLIQKVLFKKVSYEYNRSSNTLKFKNGSRVLLGGFENERDIDKYIGIEYDLIAIEELNQLTKEKVDKLKGSLRTGKDNWRPRLYTSFNPGGIGHGFCKDLFVIPFREQKQQRTRFVPSFYKDNPYLNVEYIDYLEGLQGSLGRMWRDGDWDIFAGQYFEEFRADLHVIDPYDIPDSWQKFRAYDHGRSNPACLLWGAVDHDGNVIIYREYYQKGMDIDDISSAIKKMSQGESYRLSKADPSIFARTGMVDKLGGETIAEAFGKRGIYFQPASNRRIDGWHLMHQYLAHSEDKPPKLKIFSSCKNLIREIPNAICDEHKPEDVDTDGSDHALDACRYLLMSIKERKAGVPLTSSEEGLKAWLEEKSVSTHFEDKHKSKGYEAFKKRYAK